jgi:hypothetical protein
VQASQRRLSGSELPAVVPELSFAALSKLLLPLYITLLHDSSRNIRHKSSRFHTSTTEHNDCDVMAIDPLAHLRRNGTVDR